MPYLPWIVGLPEGPGYPVEGGDFRTIGWYREQWARERWRAFCAIWLHVGLAEAERQRLEKQIIGYRNRALSFTRLE